MYMLQFMLAAIELPMTDPVLKFLLILVIILAAPLLLNKLRIPHLLGLIIAGAIIGPHGFNLISRDSSIILSGTAGLLYIMFLAGLEIDMGDFKKNKWKSLAFGIYTFLISMALGMLLGVYVLNFSVLTSALLASMFASHTLIAYPIISKLGITKNKAVTITVGGTMVTDTLALLVLTVVVGLAMGKVDDMFYYRLSGAIIVYFLFVLIAFPLIGRWFFKRVDDNISQYIFVLVMLFLGAYLAELAGLEAIIGAFIAGIALNRLIPGTSPLMNRVEFVGNALFIPFFLISVGMLIDYRAFFTSWDTLKVGGLMIVVATIAKYVCAWLTQKIFGMSDDQRWVIFGLNSAHAAATLAVVTVGYNVILGQTPDGEPIRLLNESVLNGSILMVLVTCTMASFAAQKGAHNIAMADGPEDKEDEEDHKERILIPVSYEGNVSELVNLSTAIKSKKNKSGLYALNVINNKASDEKTIKQAKKVLNMTVTTAAATDNLVHDLLRYDLNVANAIISVIQEQAITDMVLGLHQGKGISPSFLGNMTEGILNQSNVTTFIYRPMQPMATIKRHWIVVPENAEKEVGFPMWVNKMWNIALNTGAQLLFHASEGTLAYLKELYKKRPIEAEFTLFDDWNDFLIIFREIKSDDMLWIVMSRRERFSYHASMSRIPGYLNSYFQMNNFALIYPVQAGGKSTKFMI